MTSPTTKPADFDKAAPLYDDTFTDSQIGQLQRKRVYFWLDQLHFFKDTTSVFELNCGTGYDADFFHQKGLNVIATDGSPEMIKTAQAKRNKAIEFFPMDFRELAQKYVASDAIFSNFGGLNCLSDGELSHHLEETAKTQLTGNKWVGVLMPRYCLMESVYLFFKLKWGSCFRRANKNGLDVNVDGEIVKTYYHSPRRLKQLLKPHYTIQLVKPVAIFLPPSYMESYMAKHPSILRLLAKLEGFFGRFSLFSSCSDHYILIAEKK